MNNFDEVAYQAFLDAAAEKYDFATCQRSDGSKYGTGGQCRKGTPTTPGSDDKKTSSKKSGGGDAVAPAPPKTTKKDSVKSVQKEQKKTKDFLKEDNKKIAKENPGLAQKNLQVKNKKLGEEYERLRGDKSPQATARRKKIMEDVNKNMNKIKELDKKEAAKNTTRDNSPAGAKRRANAAMNARD